MANKKDTAKNEKILWNQIKSGEIGTLYLFYGPEEYLKRNYTKQIEKTLLAEEFLLMNRIVLNGIANSSAVIDNCRTLPVFSDRKVVIVKNSGFFKGAKKAAGEDLIDFLKDIPEYVCLIFIEEEIDKRVKLVDLIKTKGLIVEFDYKKPDELARWVIKRLKELGCEADPKTAAMIVEYCESGMDDILNELKKLCAYTGERKIITEQDVEEVCTKSVRSRVFDLTDAIGARQTVKALSLLNDMDVLKEPMPRVMYMIIRQFRQLIQVKLLTKDGAAEAQVAAHFRVPPFIAGKLIRQARSFSMDKLERAVSTCLELDLAVKTGQLRDKAAVELLITGLST